MAHPSLLLALSPATLRPTLQPRIRTWALATGLAMVTVLSACADADTADADTEEWRSLEVTASAYNSLPEQTHPDHPDVAAWGDDLVPGLKAIAVSRDLAAEGLTRGTEVRIEGLPGTWTVLDRMHSRWTRSIDLYMGIDVAAAREWGRQEVTIRWKVPPDP